MFRRIILSILGALGILLLAWLSIRASHSPSPAPANRAEVARLVAALQLIADEHHEALEVVETEERQRRLLQLAKLLDEASRPIAAVAMPAELTSALASIRGRILTADWVLGDPCRKLASQLVAWAGLPNAPAIKPDLAAGKSAYARACASCHGSDGSGRADLTEMQPPAPNILHPEVNLTPFEMFNRVTHGGAATAMPSFEEGLTADERWDLVFYLFAERWPPCKKPLPPIGTDELAASGDYELGKKFGYGAAACLRREFLGPGTEGSASKRATRAYR